MTKSKQRPNSISNENSSPTFGDLLQLGYRQAMTAVVVQRYVAAAEAFQLAQEAFFAARNDALSLAEAHGTDALSSTSHILTIERSKTKLRKVPPYSFTSIEVACRRPPAPPRAKLKMGFADNPEFRAQHLRAFGGSKSL